MDARTVHGYEFSCIFPNRSHARQYKTVSFLGPIFCSIVFNLNPAFRDSDLCFQCAAAYNVPAGRPVDIRLTAGEIFRPRKGMEWGNVSWHCVCLSKRCSEDEDKSKSRRVDDEGRGCERQGTGE